MVATGAGALAVVGGLPLVVRAVLVLRRLGLAEVAVFAGPQDRRVRQLLAARCPGTPCLGTAAAGSLQAGSGPGAPRAADSAAAGATAGDPDGGTARGEAAGSGESAASDGPATGGRDCARDLAPVLVVAGDLLVDETALAGLLAAARPDAWTQGLPLGTTEAHAAVCPGSALPGLLGDLVREGTLPRALRARRGASVVLAEGLAVPFAAVPSPGALERILLDDLARRTAAKDSYLARWIDRRLSRPVTRLVLRTRLRPTHVTLASLAVGLLGAAGLATVSSAGRVAGVLGLVASVVLDCVDGEVARARFEQSPAGARLDLVGDYAVHLATFLGLAVGLARQGFPPGGAWAGVLLLTGIVAAMAVVHRRFIRPSLGRGDLHAGPEGRATAFETAMERLASRDYTYLLLVLALLGRLEWFLYAAAAGAWAFVFGLLAYAGLHRRRLPASADPAARLGA